MIPPRSKVIYLIRPVHHKDFVSIDVSLDTVSYIEILMCYCYCRTNDLWTRAGVQVTENIFPGCMIFAFGWHIKVETELLWNLSHTFFYNQSEIQIGFCNDEFSKIVYDEV